MHHNMLASSYGGRVEEEGAEVGAECGNLEYRSRRNIHGNHGAQGNGRTHVGMLGTPLFGQFAFHGGFED